ncbi:hypothetical protein [Alienimonas californiensis]|uniref:Uncharacterized protein n=1 Tax=Alienimonas californiensis TaxID=2527989 RepID=A0A517PEW9_9PLAN|nr:hypothetical protein [Alienimonas californiensis]QDT17904.1 hypothetical protein CA12_40410 [Alienimonas californiensis]
MPETPAPTADAPPAAAVAAPERPAPAVAPTAGGDPFSADEYRQFAREDGRAGRFIGWLLCALFVYTIIVASAAIWWTVQSV